MAVVSVRVADEVLEQFRSSGVKPGVFCREAMEEKARLLAIDEAEQRLARFRRQYPVTDFDSTAFVRRDRDTDHGRRP